MTKAELVEKVSKEMDMSKKHTEIIVNTVIDSITKALQDGDKVELRGFGSFKIRERQPRLGRNPKTGEKVQIPSKKIPFFKPGKELKDLVNS
ncbi:MAG: integration host factor subunit beta [Acidobacteria bacterium]|nr:integration host factor subunit beta [Acidobacteriota bacterium]